MGVQNIKVSEKEQQLLIKVDHENRSSALAFVLSFSIFTAVCSSFLCGFSYSLFGSMLTVGGVFGALISGKLTEFIGCRRIMGLSSIISFGGWLSIGYSQGTMSLDIGRVALGLSNGIASYVVPVYIAEISPKEIRGGLVLVHQLIVCCGISSAFIVGLVASWRALAFIGTIPCMIQMLGLFFIPESPRWLVMRSSEEVFEQALKQFRGQNKDISHEAAEISEYTKAADKNTLTSSICSKRNMLMHLLGPLGSGYYQDLAGQMGFYIMQQPLLNQLLCFVGVSGSIGTIAMALIQLPTTALAVFLMDKHGRRPLLLFSASGMGTACFLVALSFLFKAHGWMMDSGPYFALVGILV